MRKETKTLLTIAAFGAIYLIWGSTYLAILIGLETLPPFLLAGTRFFVAGALLYGWLRFRGVPRPSDSQWWAAAMTGTLMLVGGVGGVTWAEQRIPSGIAALLVATVPLWMTVIDAAILRCSRVGWRTVIGLAIGLLGVALLLAPWREDLGRIDPIGGVVVLAAAFSWSVGSLRSRRANLPASPAMTVAVQMWSAGVVLLAISSVMQEWQQGFAVSAVSGRSLAALAYLAIIGSIVTLCAYVWLLRQVPAPAVATYAFVNPAVAVLLGWAIAGETIDSKVVLAAAMIVGAVVLIQSMQWRRAAAVGGPARGKNERQTVPAPAAEPAATSGPLGGQRPMPAAAAYCSARTAEPRRTETSAPTAVSAAGRE